MLSNDIQQFNKKIEEAKEQLGVEDDEQLKEQLPVQNSTQHGTISLVKLNGLALTKEGVLTQSGFFDNMEIDKETYGDITLTPEEAHSLTNTYRKLSTGVNAVVPLTCVAEKCPFKNTCWYFQNGKAPIGKPCLVERDLLNYHTQRFFEEFNVHVEDHSEVMLIQELAELIIYEMRVSHVLADPNNASLFGIKISFSKQGDEIQEEVIHWAWEVKEKIKNRRMRLLDALNATRKAKIAVDKVLNKNKGNGDNSYHAMIKNFKELMNKSRETQEIPFTEIKNEGEGKND